MAHPSSIPDSYQFMPPYSALRRSFRHPAFVPPRQLSLLAMPSQRGVPSHCPGSRLGPHDSSTLCLKSALRALWRNGLCCEGVCPRKVASWTTPLQDLLDS